MITHHDAATSSCSGCPGCSGSSAGPEKRVDAPLEGSRFGLVLVGVFVLPLLLAMAGACWFRAEPVGQWLGGMGGLLTGMGASVIVSKLLRRKSKQDKQV